MKYEIRYTYRIDDTFKTSIEGIYKTKLVADRHIRKLKWKHPGIEFKVKELIGG